MADWDEARVRALLDTKTPEDWHLDYKSVRVLTNKGECIGTLTKEVSGFANADGGVLIVGIEAEGPKNKRLPTAIAGAPLGSFTPESLSQLIGGNISPPFPAIGVTPVELTGDDGAGVVFVVTVPRATFAVQASNFVYYQRSDDRTEPMRGYQVQDVNNRSVGPELTMRFQLAGPTVVGPQRRLIVSASIVNQSRAPAEYAALRVGMPAAFMLGAPSGFLGPPDIIRVWETSGADWQVRLRTRHYFASATTPPLIPLPIPTSLGDFELHINEQAALDSYIPALWATYSVHMEPRFGTEWIRVANGNAELVERPDVDLTLDGMSPEEYWRRPPD